MRDSGEALDGALQVSVARIGNNDERQNPASFHVLIHGFSIQKGITITSSALNLYL